MKQCLHRKKYFKSYDKGYELICLDCNYIIKNKRDIFEELSKIIPLITSVAMASVFMDIIIKTMEKDGLI